MHLIHNLKNIRFNEIRSIFYTQSEILYYLFLSSWKKKQEKSYLVLFALKLGIFIIKNN